MKKLLLLFLIFVPTIVCAEVFNLVCITRSDNTPTEDQIYIDTANGLVKFNEEVIKARDLAVDQSNIKFNFPSNIGNVIFRTKFVQISRATGSYKMSVVSDQDWRSQFTLSGKCEPRKANKF